MYHVPLAFQYIYDAVMKVVKMGMGRKGVIFQEEGREWRLPGLLYAGDLIFCGESKEDLRAVVGRFLEVCRRRDLKVNAGKSKVIVLGEEEGLECEVCVDRIRLEHVSEFKYLECVLDELSTYETECRKKVRSGRRVTGAIRSLVNAKDCSLSVLGNCRSHCSCLFLCMVVKK